MKEVLKNLLKVKSLITILTTLVFCYLLVMKQTIPQEFQLIYCNIIAFYFGTQVSKNQQKVENINEEEQISQIQ